MNKDQKAGLDAKQRILISTIEVIKTHGMRGVRHRAIAAHAGVSLGSTTYHFKNIEDLISSTFIYWYEQTDFQKNPAFISIEQDITNLTKQEISQKTLAEQLVKDGEIYLRNQIFDNSTDRKVELAFHNEALRNTKLSQLLLNSWEKEVSKLCELYQIVGTLSPQEDAEITYALILQLEKKAMLIEQKEDLEIEFQKMKKILKRHIFLLAGVM